MVAIISSTLFGSAAAPVAQIDAGSAWQPSIDYSGPNNKPFTAVGVAGASDINGVSLLPGTLYLLKYPTDQTSGGTLDATEFAKMEVFPGTGGGGWIDKASGESPDKLKTNFYASGDTVGAAPVLVSGEWYTVVQPNANGDHVRSITYHDGTAVQTVLGGGTGLYKGTFDTATNYAQDELVEDGSALYAANGVIAASATLPSANIGTTGATWRQINATIPEARDFDIQYYASSTQANEAAGQINEGLTFVDLATTFPTDAPTDAALIVRETGQTTINGVAAQNVLAWDMWLNRGTPTANNWVKVIQGSPFSDLPTFQAARPGYTLSGDAAVDTNYDTPLMSQQGTLFARLTSADAGAGGIGDHVAYAITGGQVLDVSLYIRKGSCDAIIVNHVSNAGTTPWIIFPSKNSMQALISAGAGTYSSITVNGNAFNAVTGVQDGNHAANVAGVDLGNELLFRIRATQPGAVGNTIRWGPLTPNATAGPLDNGILEYTFIDHGAPSTAPTRHDVTINGTLYGATDELGHQGAHDASATRYFPTVPAGHVIDSTSIDTTGSTGAPTVNVAPDNNNALNITSNGGPVVVAFTTIDESIWPLWGNADGVVTSGRKRLRAETIILPDSDNSTPAPDGGETMSFSTNGGLTWSQWQAAGGQFQTEGGGPTNVDPPNSVAGDSNDVLSMQYHAATDTWAALFGSDVNVAGATPLSYPIYRSPATTIAGEIDPALGTWKGKPIYVAIIEAEAPNTTNQFLGPNPLLENVDSVRSLQLLGLGTNLSAMDGNAVKANVSRDTSGVTWELSGNRLYIENQGGLNVLGVRLLATWTKTP